MTAVKKKKKKSRNQKRDEGQPEEEAEEIIFFEPGIDSVEELLLLPFEQLEHISSNFNKIEKELIPLLNLDSVPSYPLTRDDPVLSEPSDEIIGMVKEASKRPLEILSYFKAFSHLIEKSTSSILKKLFEGKTAINYLDKEDIESKLQELWKAKCTIERMEIDEVNCGLFQVRTRAAKEILVNRALEIIN